MKPNNIIKSFCKFCENATKAVIYNGDDANTRKAVEGIGGKDMITFGRNSDNDYYPVNVCRVSGMKTTFTLMHKGEKVADMTINVPGEHNVINAVAACASALYVGAEPSELPSALESFHGAGRRFEKVGEKNGITVVDDYAHHPAEISVTLNAAVKMGYKKVWAVFQPFTFSRTAMLLGDFADALKIADRVVLTEIMGSREKNTYHIYAHDLGEKIDGAYWIDNLREGESASEYHDRNFDEIAHYVAENAEDGDLIVTLGCGDINKVSKKILTLL